jgi:flagellar protein FlbD
MSLSTNGDIFLQNKLFPTDKQIKAAKPEGALMVHLTRINRIPLVLNSDLIQHIHSSVDTVVTLTSGENIRVLETPDEIVERIIEFRRRVFAGVVFPPEARTRRGEGDG